MTAAAAPPGAPSRSDGAHLRRRALLILFWFFAVSLLFNSLFGDMGLIQGIRQRRAASRLRREVATLRLDNDRLMTEIQDLRHDPYRIETIAREDLGLIRPGEIIFLFQDAGAPSSAGLSPGASPAPAPSRSGATTVP